ncbi:hypothetical protein [Pseudomonas libanensis]|uniref:Uncharacterized protein n=1 Tax=Pseudomonas libanensis TaxID=75588 RepID=A0ABR5M795_9PSED|nr:hypothetical protein [Pseudomonas libanensis]KPG74725.1 hypothetical protein AEQ48_13695 [Pseudomonas libanensis]
MKGKVLDWKFALTTVLAIAAVAVPVYFWQADLSAYSLTVRVAASSALELPSDSKIHDLQIIVNGTKIEAPHIYSLAIINTGSKPIPTSSFETPLQVRTLNDAKLITAQITGTEPPDIPVKMSIDDNQLKVLPFLSNPLDEVRITLVSSGPLDLTAQARISGVRDIVFEDVSQTKTRPFVAFLYAVISVLSLGLYLFFLPTPNSAKSFRIGVLERVLSTLTLFIAGVYFIGKASEELAYVGSSSALIMLPLFGVGMVITLILDRRNRAQFPT